jgi:hypothetical protein
MKSEVLSDQFEAHVIWGGAHLTYLVTLELIRDTIDMYR